MTLFRLRARSSKNSPRWRVALIYHFHAVFSRPHRSHSRIVTRLPILALPFTEFRFPFLVEYRWRLCSQYGFGWMTGHWCRLIVLLGAVNFKNFRDAGGRPSRHCVRGGQREVDELVVVKYVTGTQPGKYKESQWKKKYIRHLALLRSIAVDFLQQADLPGDLPQQATPPRLCRSRLTRRGVLEK